MIKISPTSKISSDAIFWSALLLSVLWAIILPPSMGGIDAYGYEDAACNFAVGLGLKSANVIGMPNRDLSPRLLANYPPLFPLIYGLYAKILGCSPTADKYFRLIVSLTSSIVGYLMVRPSLRAQSSRLAKLAAAGMLGAIAGYGILGNGRERPDTLAFSVGVIAIMILSARATMDGGFFTSGVIIGATVLLSPFVGLACALVAFTESLERHGVDIIGRLGITVIGLAFPMSLWLVAYTELEAQWWRVFSGVTHLAVIGHEFSYLSRLAVAIFSSRSRSILLMTKWLAIFALVLYCTIRSLTARLVGIALIGALLLPMVFFPRQNCYYSAIAVIVALELARQLRYENSMGSAILPLTILLVTLPTLVLYAQASIVQLSYMDSFRRTQSAISSLVDGRRLNGRWLVVPASHYFLFKTRYNRLLSTDPDYLPTNLPLAAVGGEVSCYAGLRPGDKPQFKFVTGGSPVVLGVPDDRKGWLLRQFSHFYWGWECRMMMVAEAHAKSDRNGGSFDREPALIQRR